MLLNTSLSLGWTDQSNQHVTVFTVIHGKSFHILSKNIANMITNLINKSTCYVKKKLSEVSNKWKSTDLASLKL